MYRTDRIETTALDNINLEVGKGELVSIMGPSGCGKSTLLNLMGLLDEPSKGKVALDGKSDRPLRRPRARAHSATRASASSSSSSTWCPTSR